MRGAMSQETKNGGDSNVLRISETKFDSTSLIDSSSTGTPKQQQQQQRQQPSTSQQRNDSMSMYTNFNPTRYSTDASISSFLNIADTTNVVKQPSVQAPDLSQIGRGFSIINSLWNQHPETATTQFSTLKRPGEPVESLGPPRFKSPSFSTTKPTNTNNRLSTKRNSIYFGPNDQPANDLDLFSTKRNSITTSMKPPILVPLNSNNQLFNTTLKNNSTSASTTDFENLFNSTNSRSSSRENSLRFNVDDFDFHFKRRDSSLKGILDTAPNETTKQIDILTTKNKKGSSKKSSSNSKRKHANIEQSLNNIPDNKNQQDLDQDSTRSLIGVTKLDQLMLLLEARRNGITEKVSTTDDGQLVLSEDSNIIPATTKLIGGVEKPKNSHGTKQHECSYCHRLFTQSTHLEVHIRSHIGYKPYQCTFCGKRFTQGGNLRTHQRLHTGEKPYSCDVCNKKFSRKGNLTTHLITHMNQKPFVCKLENCNKTFTQLGNMKSHQNRFHMSTIKELTRRLAKMDPRENIPESERELLEYFSSIYKHSNKGIKGRGKNGKQPKGSTKNESTASPTNTLQTTTPPIMSQTNGIGNYDFSAIQNGVPATPNISKMANSNDFSFGIPHASRSNNPAKGSQKDNRPGFEEPVRFNEVNYKG